VDSHNRHHRHARIGQDLGDPVSLERQRAQGGGEGIAAVPQHPVAVQMEPAPILLAVDDQDAAGADGQVDTPMAVKRRWLGGGP
jgi:hypothetical protein